MVNPELVALYDKYAPRWFKVIKWRAGAKRRIDRFNYVLITGFFPLVFSLFYLHAPYSMMLCIKQPQTEEERLKLKRDLLMLPLQRDWKIDQFNHGVPPMIDVWKRRRNYPEYYEGKYDGYRQDSVAYVSSSLKGSGVVPDPEK